MHKVKKHWVVKSGVAGAMIVGSVGAPMVPHLAFAAETEEVDSGEETEVKSLADVQEESMQTVESTVPEVPVETVATETEESVEEEEKTTESTEDKTTNSTNDASKTNKSERKQSRAVDNGDGTKTWVANQDTEVIVSDIERVTIDGELASSNYSSNEFDNSLRIKLTIDNTSNEINIGDKIFIPITDDTESLTSGREKSCFFGLKGSVPGVGNIEYASDESGFVLEISESISGTKNITSLLNSIGLKEFPYYYDTTTNTIRCLTFNIYLDGQEIEKVTSSFSGGAIGWGSLRMTLFILNHKGIFSIMYIQILNQLCMHF